MLNIINGNLCLFQYTGKNTKSLKDIKNSLDYTKIDNSFNVELTKSTDNLISEQLDIVFTANNLDFNYIKELSKKYDLNISIILFESSLNYAAHHIYSNGKLELNKIIQFNQDAEAYIQELNEIDTQVNFFNLLRDFINRKDNQ